MNEAYRAAELAREAADLAPILVFVAIAIGYLFFEIGKEVGRRMR